MADARPPAPSRDLLTAEEAAGALGCEADEVHQLWRSLGFPRFGDGPALTRSDLGLLRLLLDLVRSAGRDGELAVSLARSLGHHTSRIATWQVVALVESLTDTQGLAPEDAAQRASELTAANLDGLERLLVAVWRRHVAAVTGWRMARADQHARELAITVGFADMVAYTSLTAELHGREITALVKAFEALCVDVVSAHGGRIVKTMGDALLFVADEVAPAVRIGVELAAEMAVGDGLPDVRVGIASGEVISVLGDVFGPTVNLASRLSQAADPGTVLLDETTASAADGAPGLWISPSRPRLLEGVGTVRVSVAQVR